MVFANSNSKSYPDAALYLVDELNEEMDDIVDNSKITIANDIQMLRPTWSTSSLPKRCNQDPQFASSVAAGGPSDDIHLFIIWVPSLDAGGPSDNIF